MNETHRYYRILISWNFFLSIEYKIFGQNYSEKLLYEALKMVVSNSDPYIKSACSAPKLSFIEIKRSGNFPSVVKKIKLTTSL